MKPIFISFAIEDQFARNNLTYQANQAHVPFNFTDMSVHKPWDSSWKTQCRDRIRGCSGMIALLSDNTYNADGSLWEINCAYEERIPVYLVYIHDQGMRRIPASLVGKPIYHWTWANISRFINSVS